MVKLLKFSATKGWQWFPAVRDDPETSSTLRGRSLWQSRSWLVSPFEVASTKILVQRSRRWRWCPLSFSWVCFPPCRPSETESSWLKLDLIPPAGTSEMFLNKLIFTHDYFCTFSSVYCQRVFSVPVPLVTRTTLCQGGKVPVDESSLSSCSGLELSRLANILPAPSRTPARLASWLVATR